MNKDRVFWLRAHPCWKHPVNKINNFSTLVDIYLAYVNPVTRVVEDDTSLNTHPEIWLEAGPYIQDGNEWVNTHDYNLDCGADTLEEAFVKLADLVEQHYGTY